MEDVMDALNSIPMHVFTISAGLFFAMVFFVKPFVHNVIWLITVRRITDVVGLSVVVSGVTSLGLLKGYTYTTSIVFGVLAGYVFINISRKKSSPKPEAE